MTTEQEVFTGIIKCDLTRATIAIRRAKTSVYDLKLTKLKRDVLLEKIENIACDLDELIDSLYLIIPDSEAAHEDE